MPPPNRDDWRILWRFVILAVVLVAVISGGGWFYFQRQYAAARTAAEEMLTTVAGLKVAQIANWMKERHDDADTTLDKSLAPRFLAAPDNAAARWRLLQWMEKFQKVHDYRAVALYDSSGTARLVVPDGSPLICDNRAQQIQSMRDSRKVAFMDLHRDHNGAPVHLGFLIPIAIKPEENKAPDGALLFQMDPNLFLYRVVQRWPTSHLTAETLLVRREGDEVVYLNELRHRKNTSLKLRFPINSTPRLAATMAVQGREGFVEAEDYRGIPVLAELRKIPGTPWCMVAKVDKDEVYSPLRQQVRTIVSVTVLLLLISIGGVVLLWRQQKLAFARRKLAEQKEIEKTLRASEKRLEFAQQQSHTGGWDLNLEDHTAYRSPEHDRIFGYETPLPHWTYEMFLDHVVAEDRAEVDRRFHEATAAKTDWNFECRIRRADGQLRWIWAAANHQLNVDGEIRRMSGIVQDITDRKLAEEGIRTLNAQLEQRVRERTAELQAANHELEAFSYSVSHDLRAPLRAIDGFSKVLMDDCAAKLTAEDLDHLQRIRAATQRMGILIDDLLRLSLVTRDDLRRETVDLSALAQTTVNALRQKDPLRQAEFVIAPGLSTIGDGRLLQVALDNLLENAWKFTSKHPIARIEVGMFRDNGHQAFFVRDDGAGFDMAHAGKLFGAFQRMHNQTEFEGTGIGLAMVRRIVNRLGGEVWAESAVEQGTTIYFTVQPNEKP